MLEKGKINHLLDISWGSSAKAQVVTAIAKKYRPELLISNAAPSACMVAGNLVHTEKGLIPIEQMRVGTKVYDENAELQNVSKVYDVGERPTLKINLSNGMDFTVTHNHKFKVWDSEKGEIRWVRSDELNVNVHQFVFKKHFDDRHDYVTIPILHTEQFSVLSGWKNYLDEDLGYLMGLLSGDGQYSWGKRKTYRMRIFFNTHTNSKSIQKTIKILNKYGLNVKISTKHNGNLTIVEWENLNFRNMMKFFGLGNQKHENKEVPYSILISPKSVMRAYIAGLVESDGSIPKANRSSRIHVLSNISEKLIDQTQSILHYLGFRTKKEIKRGTTGFDKHTSEEKRKIHYVLNISNYNGLVKFLKEIPLQDKKSNLEELVNLKNCNHNLKFDSRVIKSKKMKKVGTKFSKTVSDTKLLEAGFTEVMDYYYVDINSIEDARIQKVYDITVDNTHSYYVNGTISHNSHTVMDYGETFIFKVLNGAAFLNRHIGDYNPYVIVAPSAGFEIKQLIKEIEFCKLPKDRIIISARAFVVEDEHKIRENQKANGGELMANGVTHLGSTSSGQSAAYYDKISRDKTYKWAGEREELEQYATILDYNEFTDFIINKLKEGATALTEMPQGFPLSLDYSQEIRKSTYRNINPLQLMSDLGISVKYLGKVIGNMRSLPIRVSNRFVDNDIDEVKLVLDTDGEDVVVRPSDIGLSYDDINSIAHTVMEDQIELKLINEFGEFVIKDIKGYVGSSGSFESDMQEISWKQLSEELGQDVAELTTLTRLPRRIAKPVNGYISIELMYKVIKTIAPDYLSVTFMNYLGIDNVNDPKFKDYYFNTQRLLNAAFGEDAPLFRIAQFGKYVDDVKFI
jgi:intein/homing endonuclease